MNPEAESINRGLTGTRRAIQGADPSPPRSERDTPVHPSAAGPPSASDRHSRNYGGLPGSRKCAGGTRLADVRPRRAANPGPRMAAPYRQSARASRTLRGGNIDPRAGQSILGLWVLPNWLNTRRQRPVNARDQPGNAHDLRRQRLQRQRPQRRAGNTVSVIDTRRCQARRRLALQGAVADDHRREPAERDRHRRADRHRVRDQRRRQHRLGVQRRHLQRDRTRRLRADAREVPVGLQPIEIFADPANHTVYVANYGAPALADRRGTARPSR